MKKNLAFILLFLISSTQLFAQYSDTIVILPDTNKIIKEFYIPKPLGITSDFEGVLTPKEIYLLDSFIMAIEKKTTIEIGIISIDSTMINEDNFEKYTLMIAQKWNIGKPGKNNGILIGFSDFYKKIRIQNAKGITTKLSDKKTKEIIENVFLPYFKMGLYYQGLVLGINEMISEINKNTAPKKTTPKKPVKKK
jgi:uncharacterized protein